VYIDVLGRIVIADGATRALHVFDSLGKLAFVWEPASGAAGVPRWPADIDADDEGRFRVQLDRTNEGFVVIERDRARGPVVAPGINRFAARRGTSEFWGRFHKNFEEAEELRCVSGDGVVRATFARRPDGRWWREIDAVGVATDGSVAVLDKPRWLTTDSRERTLALYAPDGKDARLIELPREDVVARSQHHLVVGARWIVLQTEEPGVCLVSRADGSLHHFEEPSFDSNNRWTAALSPDERELWIARMTPPTLLRYALPAE
jgi:hypothetical protein